MRFLPCLLLLLLTGAVCCQPPTTFDRQADPGAYAEYTRRVRDRFLDSLVAAHRQSSQVLREAEAAKNSDWTAEASRVSQDCKETYEEFETMRVPTNLLREHKQIAAALLAYRRSMGLLLNSRWALSGRRRAMRAEARKIDWGGAGAAGGGGGVPEEERPSV
jgi:hypothetical protein